MDNPILRTLILDHSADDAEQLITALRTGPYILKPQRAPSGDHALALLADGNWDLLLVEPAAPGAHLSRLTAANRMLALPVPILVTTHKTASLNIPQYMADGARDVLFKGEWDRLLPAIARELDVLAQRREFSALKERHERIEARYRAMIENSQEAVCFCHAGVYVDANTSYLNLLGYADLEELKGVPLLDMIDKADRPRFKTLLQKGTDSSGPVEFNAVHRDGRHAPVEITVSPVDVAGEPCLQISLKDISRHKALEHKIGMLNQRDPLTGLANKRKFAIELNQCLEKIKTGGTCTLITLELLRLRELNDKLGQATTDRALLMLSGLLKQQTEDGHLLGRLGGGQFAVLLRGLPREQSGLHRDRYQAIAREFRFAHQGKTLDFEFAFGIGEIDAGVQDVQKFLNDCYKTALDNARQPRGKASTSPAATLAPMAPPTVPVVETPRAPAAVETTPMLEVAAAIEEAVPIAPATPRWKAEIERALANEGLHLHFQPIINVHGEIRELFEAVLYLESAQGELVPARVFMPAAEEHGLAGKIDRWVAMRSAEALTSLINGGKPATLLAPMSSATIADNLLLAAIQQHLKTASIPAEYFRLQVEAAALARDPGAAMAFAQIVKRTGVGLVINNESAETLEPALMRTLPCDYYKVPATHLGSLKKAVYMAHGVDMSVIATGVENGEMFATLWSENVDYMQGDYLCPPMPVPDYSFADEQELSSDTLAAPNWSVNR
jgi:PAS domain S-box-containing protein/diguanylate cyclase (GGDEF)-like protein